MNKAKKWLVPLLSVLISAIFIMSAVMKLRMAPQAVEGFTHVGIPVSAIIPIGIVELLCLAIFLVPRTTVLGSILLTGYLGGAIMTHILMRQPWILPFLIGVVIWGITWLRVDSLRSLIPLRSRRSETIV